ncbi:mkt1 [Symbiodinium sp. CCMP2592]|nr:mkt1 [Symbiodinium sp. CCMP2592]
MRVRHLQTHLADQGLVNSGPLRDLRNVSVGVDAVFWLRSIQALKDPFADALGGIPPGIFGFVDKELEQFKENNITPYFVFQGVAPGPQHSMFVSRMDHQMDLAWKYLAHGERSAAQKCFAVSTSRINGDFVYFIFHHLRQKGYECFQAPYFAGAQLAHFAEQNLVQTIFGPPGLLLYGVKTVIIHLNFSQNTFDWVDLDSVLNKWQLSWDSFVEACMLAGTEYCLTYPYLNLSGQATTQQQQARFNFEAAVYIIKQGPLIDWMGHFPSEEMKTDHVDGYCICKVLVQNSPVLHLQDYAIRPLGACKPGDSPPPVPSDFAAIMGQKLPPALYYLMLHGFGAAGGVEILLFKFLDDDSIGKRTLSLSSLPSGMSGGGLPLAILLACRLLRCDGDTDPCWSGVPDDVRELCCKLQDSSCFSAEFTFDRCCEGVQTSASSSLSGQVPPMQSSDHDAPCFEEGSSFTYEQCCESAGHVLKVLISDGGCFDPSPENGGGYTYLRCCLELPDPEQWIYVEQVRGSPMSEFFHLSGTLYMTEAAKRQFRQKGAPMPPATLGGVSHADLERFCLKQFLYDSKYQLLPMWSRKEIYPPPPKDINKVIKLRTRMKEAAMCWNDIECNIYIVKLDWWSMDRKHHEGAYVLTLPVACNLGEAAVTLIPLLADSRIDGPVILGGATFQQVREGWVLLRTALLRCYVFGRRSSGAAASKDTAPNVAIDILRLLAAWIVVDTHRGQPFPFSWPICYMTGADILRLEDIFVVVTVRLMSVRRLTLQSFAMKILRKVAIQGSTLIAFTHFVCLFIRPASPWYCGQKLFFEHEQPRADLKGWSEWLLAAVTMRNFEDWVRPAFPADDLPNPSWQTSTWLVCLEYTIVWCLGAAHAIDSVLPGVIPAATLAYVAWMCMDVDRQPQVCVSWEPYQSFWYCRLPSAILTHCACRALARFCGPSGFISHRWTPVALAAIGSTLGLSTLIEGHPAWEAFGFGKHHCRQQLPYMVAGLPFQFSLLAFTFLDIKVPEPAAAWVSYLANLNFCIVISHQWMLIFFEKHAPEFTSAWASVKSSTEGSLFAMQQLFIIYMGAALLHGFVAKPVQLLVQELAQYSSLIPPLAVAHLALCLITWPHDRSYYPLFTYSDTLSHADSPPE